MPDSSDLDWLERDQDFVEGLDHLGILVVSTNIYARLLPGVSNLTERARYFGFYAWVLQSFAKSDDTSPDAWRNWIRRHEFTLSAAGIAAEQDGLAKEAGGGLVGAVVSKRLLKGNPSNGRVDIAEATRLEGGKAAKGTYFKNREGGYSQYYKGPMTALGLLRPVEGRKAPDRQLTSYAGVTMAETIEGIESFRNLREMARSGASVSADELAELGRQVHPGAIPIDGDEATKLRALLAGSDDHLCAGQLPAERSARQHTLAVALDYLGQGDDGWSDPVRGFRWAVLERRLEDGRAWTPSEALQPISLAWAAYAQNELFNFSMEKLLWAVLRLLDDGPRSPSHVAARIADVACHAVAANADRPVLPKRLGDAVDGHSPPASEACWGPEGTWQLFDDLSGSRDVQLTVQLAVRLLLRTAADRTRYHGAHPFAAIPGGLEIVRSREIHLQGWWERVDAERSADTRSFLERLVIEWVVYRHLRVATRKLASQGDYTFRFRVEGGQLVACGDFEPTLTNPRLRQAFRIMADVGFASHDLSMVTGLGNAFVGGFR